MTETFLHYIWQFQYFDKHALKTTTGEDITILKTGILNSHAGPDFTNAKIRVGELEWLGHVEIHLHASEWMLHKHQYDKAYDSVILHVVWKNDKVILRSDGTSVPTLELQKRIDERLLLNYKKLINQPLSIPCASSLPSISSLIKLSTVEKALIQRLQTKAKIILVSLQKNKNDWEETLYQALGRNFGFKVNSETFEQLTEAIPYKIILKHADRPLQLEALLLGTAGLLKEGTDEYANQLKQEYALLKVKYDLGKKELHPSHWRFLRLRPANFPSLRIAQFASLLSAQKSLFSKLLAAESIQELKQLFDVLQSTYWQQHYQVSKPSKKAIPGLGDAAIENICINTVAPMLAAYSVQKDEVLWMERAVDFLSKLPPENNAILREWTTLGWKATSAFDSQGLIELKNSFCANRLCLNCSIGVNLVRTL